MRSTLVLIALLAVGAGSVFAASIPADQIEEQSIYAGDASNFEKPAAVNYEKVVKATPAFKELRKKKIDKGSAKYWILMSQASEHAVRVILEHAGEAGYDLVAEKSYLSGLDPKVEAEDITDKVLKAIADGK